MSEQQIFNGNLALKKTPRVVVIPPNETVRGRKLRVAAYVRVSSNSSDQLNSYAAQNAHYTELITGNSDWDFVDVYADKGITGTSAEKRDDFQRLLQDCRRGRIDLVLTKSSSRFARNTKESLEAARELKALGIGVYFEEQNLNTAELSGELMAAIFALLAQKGSESISENLRWSIDKRMRAGKYNTCRAPFGYHLEKGTLVLDPETVPIIQYIFDAYLSGKTTDEIKDVLNIFSEDKPWKARGIDYILKNERYCGNAILRKRINTVTLPRKQKRNWGEQPMYFVEGINEAAITVETFEKAQELRRKRRETKRSSLPGLHPLSGWVRCGACGKLFRPKMCSGKWYMSCRNHDKNARACNMSPIPENVIISASLRVYYKLRHQGVSILNQMLMNLQNIRSGKLLWSLDIVALNDQIAEITRQERLLAELRQQGLVDPDIFISRDNALAERLRTVKLEKERLLEFEEDNTLQKTRELIEALESGPEFLENFDGELFGELVESIIAESNTCLRFRLVNGLELTETIERKVR